MNDQLEQLRRIRENFHPQTGEVVSLLDRAIQAAEADHTPPADTVRTPPCRPPDPDTARNWEE